MIVGDVVLAKNIRIHFQNDEVNGSVDMKCPKGSIGVFLVLGIIDEKKVDEFDPVKRLADMGYIQSPDFVQSERDKKLQNKA